MESVSSEEEWMEQFPVGMRVLAVDDNPTCLRKLEDLLLRCKYHVTTTKEAKAALEMLREKSNKFDLVITDVEMPDMDGFKLLELVGLEMDLPLEASQFPGGKCPAYMGDSRIIGDHAIFLDSRASFGGSSSTCSNSQMLRAKYQQPLHKILAGHQSSLQGAPSVSGSLDVSISGYSRCSDSWEGNVKTTKIPLDSLPLNQSLLSREELLNNNNFNSFIFAGGEMQCQTNLPGNFVQNTNTSDQQSWEEHGRDCTHMLNNSFSPANDMVMDMVNAARSKGSDGSLTSPIDGSGAILSSQPARLEPEMRSNKGCSLEHTKSGNGFINDPHDSFDDMMNEMMKHDDSVAAGFELDSFPLP